MNLNMGSEGRRGRGKRETDQGERKVRETRRRDEEEMRRRKDD